MGSDIKKFVNPKFLNSIDVVLMRDLFARHFKDEGLPVTFEGGVPEIRKRMTEYFATPITEWSEGLIADLHRVAELGTGEGMQLILNEARRQGVVLYSEPDDDEADPAPVKHEPKHVALHALNRPDLPGEQNSRRIAPYGQEEEHDESVPGRVPGTRGADGRRAC